MYLSNILTSISLIYQPYYFQIAVVFLSFSQRYFFLTLIGPRLNWRMSVTRYPHPIIRLSNSFSFIIFIFQLFLEIVLTIHCKLWILLGCLYTNTCFWCFWWIIELCLTQSCQTYAKLQWKKILRIIYGTLHILGNLLIAMIASDISAVLNLPDKPKISTKSDISLAIHLSLTPFLPLHYKLMWQYGSIQHQ